jgi:hypothetical protein
VRREGSDDILAAGRRALEQAFDKAMFVAEAESTDAKCTLSGIKDCPPFQSFVMERAIVAASTGRIVAAKCQALEEHLKRSLSLVDESSAGLVPGIDMAGTPEGTPEGSAGDMVIRHASSARVAGRMRATLKRAVLRAELSSVDFFDAWSFARMVEQAAEMSHMRKEQLAGEACVATLGTTDKGMFEVPGVLATLRIVIGSGGSTAGRKPRWRWLVLRNNVLAWYDNTERRVALARELMALSSLPSRDPGAVERRVKVKTELKRLEADVAGLYELVPGRTSLFIPEQKAFPTEFALGIIKDEPRPGEIGHELSTRPGAGPGERKLTLCFQTAGERRNWARHIRARLQPKSHRDLVRSTYLGRQQLSQPTVALLNTARRQMMAAAIAQTVEQANTTDA